MVRMSRICTFSSRRFCRTLQGRKRQELGSQVFHQFGRLFRQAVEAVAATSARPMNSRRVYMDQMIQVSSHHRPGIDHCMS